MVGTPRGLTVPVSVAVVCVTSRAGPVRDRRGGGGSGGRDEGREHDKRQEEASHAHVKPPDPPEFRGGQVRRGPPTLSRPWTASTPTASPTRSPCSPRPSGSRPSTPTPSRCGARSGGCSRRSRSSGAPSGARRSSPTTPRSPRRPRPARPAGSTTRRRACRCAARANGASAGTLLRARACYVCKQRYVEVDAFYHQLCPACAALNHARRDARTDLTGRRALLTGGRAKIGMYIALRLLRDGAHTTITTRFPRDAVAPLRRDGRQRRLAAPPAHRRHRPARPRPGRRARRRRRRAGPARHPHQQRRADRPPLARAPTRTSPPPSRRRCPTGRCPRSSRSAAARTAARGRARAGGHWAPTPARAEPRSR